MIDLAARYAVMKASNHPFYVKVLTDAAKDNTFNALGGSTARYVSNGRWSALAYRMSGDSVHAQRAFDHVKNTTAKGNFATVPIPGANDLREHYAEYVQTLSMIKPVLSSAHYDEYKEWLLRVANSVVANGVRIIDSDQVIGTHFFMALVDKEFGTSYDGKVMKNPSNAAIPLTVHSLRTQVTYIVDTLGQGGVLPESSDYNLGTLYLLFNGAEWAGIEKYPEIVRFRDAFAKQLAHMFTPDLKDTFEWGDDQTSHALPFHSLEDLFAYLGNYYPEILALEEEVRGLRNKKATEALYPRYYLWANPMGTRQAWRPWAGTFLVAPGFGQVYARESWQPEAGAVMAWFPPFSEVEQDHTHKAFGAFRFYKSGWKKTYPIGYSANVLVPDHVLLAGLGASWEIGKLTGHFFDGKVFYASGTNAGSDVGEGYDLPPATFRHELTPSIFGRLDRNVFVVIHRIHVEPPTGLDRYPLRDQQAIAASPLIQTLWHSVVKPVVQPDGSVLGDMKVTPVYPADVTVVDEMTIVLNDHYGMGRMPDSEKKWQFRVVPKEIKPFQILVTVIGDATAEVSQLGDVHQVVVKQAGYKDWIIQSSARPGPKLVTTKGGNQGRKNVYDPRKIDAILEARKFDVMLAQSTSDHVVESSSGVSVTYALENNPTPIPSGWRVTESTDTRIVLERVV